MAQPAVASGGPSAEERWQPRPWKTWKTRGGSLGHELSLVAAVQHGASVVPLLAPLVGSAAGPAYASGALLRRCYRDN
jgi:hypothetical protein